MTKMAAASVFEEDVAESRGMATWKQFEARQGRSATFDEIGDVVVLMCTPKMSLVVGQNLFIDGYVDLSCPQHNTNTVSRGFTVNESNS